MRQGSVERGVFNGDEGSPERGLAERSDEHASAGAKHRHPLLVGERRVARTWVERVEAVGGAAAEPDRRAADGFGDDGPFALGVAGDIDTATERDRPGGDRLGEARLALADDAREQAVRVRQDALLIEDPRVEAEPAAGPGILADVDTGAAEPGFGEEGVGAGHHVGGGPVRRQPQPPVGPQSLRPRLTSGRQVAAPTREPPDQQVGSGALGLRSWRPREPRPAPWRAR